MSWQAIKALTDKLNETTDKVAPRTRFQFKSRTQAAAGSNPLRDPRRAVGFSEEPTSLGDTSNMAAGDSAVDSVGPLPNFPKNYNEEMARPSLGSVRKPSFSAARDINISGHTGLHIILPSSASRATTSGAVTNMHRCIVDMSAPTATSGAPFASLAIKNIENSLIIAGHVTGSAHITGVRDSVVVVAARQVRIHECKNVVLYLHCTSHPIIEDCSGMQFAPLPACYVSLPPLRCSSRC
jgi:tubulin-specific chaperone C